MSSRRRSRQTDELAAVVPDDATPMFEDEDPAAPNEATEGALDEESDIEEQAPEGQLDYESEETTASGTESLTWIAWFCSLPGHECAFDALVRADF